MKSRILATVVGGVILFIWGFISWAVLPWHSDVANKFSNEEFVAEFLKANAPRPGIYYIPFSEEDVKLGKTSAFMSIVPDGFDMNMSKKMAIGMLGQIASALIVVILAGIMIGNSNQVGYGQCVKYIAMLGFAIGFIGHFPYWNWFEFSTPYVAVIIADTVIAWLLAGLAMSKFLISGRS